MAQSWQTIEQAAVSLRLSVRTVNRHIVAGKLPSRLTDGRREVLVDLPDGGAAAGASASGSPFADGSMPLTDASSPAAGLSNVPNPNSSGERLGAPTSAPNPSSAITVDQETVLALADNAAEKAEMAVAAYQALARVADAQAQQIRRNARLAWAAVAVMAMGVTGAVGWATHRVTRLSVEREDLIGDVADSVERADKALAAVEAARADFAMKQQSVQADFVAREDALRAESAAAREDAARTEGKLAALEEQERQRRFQEVLATASATGSLLSNQPAPSLSQAVAATQPTSDSDGVASAAESQLESGNASDTSGTAPHDFPREASANIEGAVASNRRDDQDDERAASANPSPRADRSDLEADASSELTPGRSDGSDERTPSRDTGSTASDTGRPASPSTLPTVTARRAKTAGPSTRPVALRRKAPPRAPQTGPSSDATSASTADER